MDKVIIAAILIIVYFIASPYHSCMRQYDPEPSQLSHSVARQLHGKSAEDVRKGDWAKSCAAMTSW